jgi:hypothetical protein
MPRALPLFAVCLFVLGGGCGPQRLPDRVPGVRAPLSAACDPLDETRCLLPWPSSTYTVADASSPTGLRVSIPASSLPVMDEPAPINRLDGFSVATPLAVGFPRAVAATLDGAATTTAVRLFIAQPGATRGSEIGLRLSVVKDTHGEATLLLAYPRRPLAYDTDYVAVVLDELPAADGGRFEAPRAVRVALGLAAPSTDAEAALLAYHAPTRALLADVGIAPERVIRVWDFTTRSAAGVSAPLTAMRARATAAVAAGAVTVVVDSARLFDDQSALEVRGRVEGLPLFAGATGFSLDDNALPTQLGVHAVPFRAVAPAGSGPYPMVVYGHGTGGTVDDDSFDREIVAEGAGKLNLEWAGWTEDTVLSTLLGLQELVSGTERSTARLLQSLADAAALEAALDGALGDALAAPTVAGVANPAAGRRPDARGLVYAGGSLGGTMGYVHSLVDPGIRHAVLNVPGAGWTHFAPASDLWARISGFLLAVTPSAIDVALGMAMTQSSWDPVDGAAWSALSTRTDQMFLVQESIGDPILPNIGSELVATSSGAVQVGAVIVPIDGVAPVAGGGGATRTAITQFRVPSTVTSALDIHGFAAKGSPAGIAAREQIAAFLRSVWAGAPRIDMPPTCAARPTQSCDFSTGN